MAETRDPDSEHSPYLRLPWPAVALVLVVLLGVALGVGTWANRNVEPRTIAQSSPEASAFATPTSLAIATLAATTQATALVVPQATVSPTVSPRSAVPGAAILTVVPTLAEEVGNAYQFYWQVRAEALLRVDASRLQEVMAGEHLAAVQDRIAELRVDGHAIETDIDHHYAVFDANTSEAKVADIYVDQSVYIDMQTHARLTQPANENLRELYTMNKLNGTWRVVDLVRSSS
jgi:hypothetical protein